MNILISANKDFIKYAKNLIFSVAKNNKDVFLNVYLIYTDLNSKEIDSLSNFILKKCHGKLYIYKTQKKDFEEFPVSTKNGKNFYGIEAYLRLFAQYILPVEVKKILYLDIDIICDGSLHELYNQDFDDNVYIGCEEKGISNDEKKRLNIDYNQKYINSGVLLMNLEQLREQYKKEDIFKFIDKNKGVLDYPDQDIINMLFQGKIKIISDKYNFRISFFKGKKVDEKIIVYHYVGENKPWQSKNTGIELKYMLVYFKYIFLQGKIITGIIIFIKYLLKKLVLAIKRRIIK